MLVSTAVSVKRARDRAVCTIGIVAPHRCGSPSFASDVMLLWPTHGFASRGR